MDRRQRRRCRYAAADRLDECGRLVTREWRQVEALRESFARELREQVGEGAWDVRGRAAVRDRQQQRGAGQQPGEVLEEQEGGRVRPVQVVEQEEEPRAGGRAGDADERAGDALEEPVALAFGAERWWEQQFRKV